MALNKYKLGELIGIVDERNIDDLALPFYGININKEFMPTVANTDNLDRKKYKVVRQNRFVYSGMQTGRDECIRISMQFDKTQFLVSPAYTTFEVVKPKIILPEYLFMIFNSKEKDRLGWFYSDSSIRSNLDWDRFCDIDIVLPDIDVQQKYVDIYNAMKANQKAYETGLEDLENLMNITLEEFKHSADKVPVENLLKEIDVRNRDGNITDVQGINIEKRFMPSVASLTNTDLTKYKIISKNQFAYSAMQTGRDECIRIALFNEEQSVIISPAYSVLEVKSEEALAEYIMLWFSRKESDRYGWFISDSSVRASLDLSSFYEINIPLPEKEKQAAVVSFYKAYTERRSINDKLKAQIKDICPILIKGSLEEANI